MGTFPSSYIQVPPIPPPPPPPSSGLVKFIITKRTFYGTATVKIVTEERHCELFTLEFCYCNLCICVFHESAYCVSLGYYFLTAGGIIQDSNFKYFCIIDVLLGKSKFSPTISFILRQLTGQVSTQDCARRHLN